MPYAQQKKGRVKLTYQKILRFYISMANPWNIVDISQTPKYLANNIRLLVSSELLREVLLY